MDFETDTIFPRDSTGRDGLVRNMFRNGKVIDRLVDDTGVFVRVQFLDRDGLVSRWLPVKQAGSRGTSSFYCPKIRDDVSVTMLPNTEGGEGFVDGCFYNTGNPPPITRTEDADRKHVTFGDSTVIEYVEGPAQARELGKAGVGKGKGSLNFASDGPIVISCNNLTISAANIILKAGTITLDGNVHITGNLTVDGTTNMKQAHASPNCTNSDGSGGGT
jgi:phage baseplate assembly protein V